MVLMTCLNGYFVMPTIRSLVEEMLLAHKEDPQTQEVTELTGAVAAFASTGMTPAQAQNLLDQGFMEAVFQTGITRLGEATYAAKETLLGNTTNEQDTANSFSLMGDPAMTLGSPSSSGSSTPIVGGGGGGGGGGCFIASATYGSFLDGHVGSLRAFRDRVLARNPIGNYLVRSYYTLSPPAAGWIKQHENIRALTRIALVPVVAMAKLNLDRMLIICVTMLLLISPLAWTHCLTKRRKRVIIKK
jgi:hypothetical protein